jgi:RHS repeat-associated protein
MMMTGGDHDTWDAASRLPVVIQDGTYSYVYGLDLISMTDGSGNQTYVSYDGLGSVSDLTDGTGAVTDTFVYDAFGTISARTGTTATAWKFTGEQADDGSGDTGYYFLRARYYDPTTGRFISRDAIEFAQRYAYAGDNPALIADANGACPQHGPLSSLCRKITDPGVWKPVAGAAVIAAADIPGVILNYSCVQTLGVTCKVAEVYDLAVVLPATDLGVCLIQGQPLVVHYDFCSHQNTRLGNSESPDGTTVSTLALPAPVEAPPRARKE